MSEWTGVLDLVMENRQGRSVAKSVYFQGAFKVMRPVYFNKNSYPCYYLLNPGGGYLDGDRYQMKVTLGERAMLTLTTQSATKVYRTPTEQVYQETVIRMKKDSYLEYLPDAIIAYKDASCYQKNSVYMEKGATLLYAEILTPGWSPEGEKFSYEMLRLKTEIYMEGQLVVFDHIKLHPASQDMNELGFMEGYTHLGSLIVVGEKTNDALLDRLYEVLQQEAGEFAFGLSKLAVPGFTIRILANYTQVIERIISVCHHVISEEWNQMKPSFLRKY
ncbi:urease accessory protein [Sporosarcina sp. P34]|uniref:urease accessory protein UreD n=1 Tax=Sporosarcina sp. P34 TaxID=2048247 RepID=UPI000C16CF1D|nr:urease accessory protein UreD [Sporosarcina sp. P34]PID15965.1 urease accessory protein [Sporosarcina sp. P34]